MGDVTNFPSFFSVLNLSIALRLSHLPQLGHAESGFIRPPLGVCACGEWASCHRESCFPNPQISKSACPHTQAFTSPLFPVALSQQRFAPHLATPNPISTNQITWRRGFSRLLKPFPARKNMRRSMGKSEGVNRFLFRASLRVARSRRSEAAGASLAKAPCLAMQAFTARHSLKLSEKRVTLNK